MMMPRGTLLISNPAQTASAPVNSTPRLWLKLKPIQARHMSVLPRDNLRAVLAIARATAGSAGGEPPRLRHSRKGGKKKHGPSKTHNPPPHKKKKGDPPTHFT